MTRVVDITEAAAGLSALIEVAENGEDVTITRGGIPCAKLVPVSNAHRIQEPLSGRLLRA